MVRLSFIVNTHNIFIQALIREQFAHKVGVIKDVEDKNVKTLTYVDVVDDLRDK